MSSITRTVRFVGVNMASRCVCVRYYIMRNAYTQAHYNLARPVCIPRRDPHLDVMRVHMIAPTCHMSRRDHVHNHACMYSRDRNRRT